MFHLWLRHHKSAVLVGDTADDENMDVPFEAGVSSALGAAVPQTPHDVQQSDAAPGVSPGDSPSGAVTSAVVHPRDGGEDSERPAKHQRILAFFEHEDQPNETQFDSEDLDELESYDFDFA